MRPRQPIIAARRRLMPWLLLVVALAALGIWSGGHCAEHHTEAHATALSASGDRPDPQGQVTDQHDVDRKPHPHQPPSAAGEHPSRAVIIPPLRSRRARNAVDQTRAVDRFFGDL